MRRLSAAFQARSVTSSAVPWHPQQAAELALVGHVRERLTLLRRAQHDGGVAREVLVLGTEAEAALRDRPA